MTLTDAIRAYLRAARGAHYLLVDVITELRVRFGLNPDEIGRVLAQDLQERS